MTINLGGSPALATYFSQLTARTAQLANPAQISGAWLWLQRLGIINSSDGQSANAWAPGVSAGAFEQAFNAGASVSDALAEALKPVPGQTTMPQADLMGRAWSSVVPLQEELETRAADAIASANAAGQMPADLKPFAAALQQGSMTKQQAETAARTLYLRREVGLSDADAKRIGGGSADGSTTDLKGQLKPLGSGKRSVTGAFTMSMKKPSWLKSSGVLLKPAVAGPVTTKDISLQAGSLDIGLVVGGLALAGALAYAAGWLKL